MVVMFCLVKSDLAYLNYGQQLVFVCVCLWVGNVAMKNLYLYHNATDSFFLPSADMSFLVFWCKLDFRTLEPVCCFSQVRNAVDAFKEVEKLKRQAQAAAETLAGT